MPKAHHIMYVLALVYLALVLVGTFRYNLPSWCDNPDGVGNWMVQPLCKKAVQ